MLKRKGFTLVEVALAFAVSLIIIGTIVSLGSMVGGGKHMITTYNGGHSHLFFVNSYQERNGGIEFDDWQGHHRFTDYTIRN